MVGNLNEQAIARVAHEFQGSGEVRCQPGSQGQSGIPVVRLEAAVQHSVTGGGVGNGGAAFSLSISTEEQAASAADGPALPLQVVALNSMRFYNERGSCLTEATMFYNVAQCPQYTGRYLRT